MKKPSIASAPAQWAMAALFALTGVAPSSVKAAEISFRVFDEAGTELTYAQVVSRMTNKAGSDYMSDGAMDLLTLKAVALNTGYNSGGKLTLTVNPTAAYPKQGLMVHWNTLNTGYSSFLLDNGGAGFTANQTLIFNEQLARDAQRQFNGAYSRRIAASPPYAPSAAFTTLKTNGEKCMTDKLTPATAPSLKGKYGQECLDYFAQAMTLMLKEYGMQQARRLDTLRNYGVWGVSTDPTSTSYQTNIDGLVPLFEPRHRWTRLIMENTTNAYFAKVRTTLNYATSKQVQTLGQLFDSSIQSSLSLTAFKTAVDRALAYPDFNKFTAWEVGNEVNGGWLGGNMPAKIAYAATQVKAKTGKKVCLTFYWYGIEDSLKTSLFNWIGTNVTQQIKDNIDCVALSVYIDQQPLNFSWDLVMTKLGENFPGKMVMIGELGFIDPSVASIYREGPLTLSNLEGGKLYISNRYPASFATAGAVGGDFWWYYDQEMAGQQPLWTSLHTIYCQTYAGYADVSNVCR